LDGLGYRLKRNKGKKKMERKEVIITIIEVKITIRTIIINNNYILITI